MKKFVNSGRKRRARAPCALRYRFWGARAVVGQVLELTVPASEELRLTQGCGSSETHVVVQKIGEFGTNFLVSSSKVSTDGTRLHSRLLGGESGSTYVVTATVGHNVAQSSIAADEVSLLGYCCESSSTLKKKLNPCHEVKLPVGWAGLAFKEEDCRLVVTDVPKVCYSSFAFGCAAAAQVLGVSVGDEIKFINGIRPHEFADRISRAGDPLNQCHVATPPHAPGALGKWSPNPCVSCDFVRRRTQLGLDGALLLWIRAVKRELPIILKVGKPGRRREGRKLIASHS